MSTSHATWLATAFTDISVKTNLVEVNLIEGMTAGDGGLISAFFLMQRGGLV